MAIPASGRGTDKHRQVLNEAILSDRTVNEAAEVLGIPLGTVKSRSCYQPSGLTDKCVPPPTPAATTSTICLTNCSLSGRWP